MNLWIFSDLHHDHGRFYLEPPAGADVAIAAGDIQNDDFLVALARQLPVVFVAGNHEFYGHTYADRLAALRALPGVTVLDNDTATIGGVRFHGATLWTDYGYNPLAAETARRGMNDHRYIKWTKEPYQRFLPSHATKMHEASIRYLDTNVKPGDVVVTHHAPSERSVAPKYAGQLLNHAYFSALDAEIEAWKPALWVHGHVHTSFDYQIGNTRVLCNPHGYPGENPDLDPALVVAV